MLLLGDIHTKGIVAILLTFDAQYMDMHCTNICFQRHFKTCSKYKHYEVSDKRYTKTSMQIRKDLFGHSRLVLVRPQTLFLYLCPANLNKKLGPVDETIFALPYNLVSHGRLRLDKKSIIRQYRNLQRAKTKSNIISHYTVHVLRTTNHTYFETFSKNK